MPVDPAVRVGDIVFGTDKLAHFFTNGARYFARYFGRYFARYQAVRDGGASVDDAEDAAIAVGLGEKTRAAGPMGLKDLLVRRPAGELSRPALLSQSV